MGRWKLTLEQRFWSKVDRSAGPDACWPWRAYRSPRGYGMFGVGKRVDRAHRVALMLSGVSVPAGAVVCHRCDFPPCTNPAHLYVGTQADNVRDAVERGRFIGRRTNPRKYSSEAVVAAVAASRSLTEAARRLGMRLPTLSTMLTERGLRDRIALPDGRRSRWAREAIRSAALAAAPGTQLPLLAGAR